LCSGNYWRFSTPKYGCFIVIHSLHHKELRTKYVAASVPAAYLKDSAPAIKEIVERYSFEHTIKRAQEAHVAAHQYA